MNFKRRLSIFCLMVACIFHACNTENNKVEEMNRVFKEHEQGLEKFSKEYKDSSKRQIINDVLASNFGLNGSDPEEIIGKLKISKKYHADIYLHYDSTFKATLEKLEALKIKYRGDIYSSHDVGSYIEQLKTVIDVHSTNYQQYLALMKDIEKIQEIASECKYINSKGKLLFYKPGCLKRLNAQLDVMEKNAETYNNSFNRLLSNDRNSRHISF